MKSILITGGCSFISCNAAVYFKNQSRQVTLLDNLARAGTEKNLDWPKTQGDVEFKEIDIRQNREGGGPKNTLSLLQLVRILEEKLKRKLSFNFRVWRPTDQKVFTCDTSKFSRVTDWKPQVSTEWGGEILIDEVIRNRAVLESVLR